MAPELCGERGQINPAVFRLALVQKLPGLARGLEIEENAIHRTDRLPSPEDIEPLIRRTENLALQAHFDPSHALVQEACPRSVEPQLILGWSHLRPNTENLHDRVSLGRFWSGLCLPQKLTKIAFRRRPKGHLENELANWHSNIKDNLIRSKIDHFKLDLPLVAGVDGGGSKVDN
jgi:hypothetical protein